MPRTSLDIAQVIDQLDPAHLNLVWPAKVRVRLARDVVTAPGCCSKCADARRRNADLTINITRSGRGARTSVFSGVPLGYVIFASHGGRCQHAGGDQSD